jgi:nitroimidazol reductase NimA-like FMN-containing flavoprotein (pyridoxamine 5'-phosphate oxidase superfamily)
MAENPIEDLTESACLELLRDHHFGRVAFVEQADGPPVITPVNYLLHRGAVVFEPTRTASWAVRCARAGGVRDRRN